MVFGGRLGEYKYYDMDAVIASALDMCEKEFAWVRRVTGEDRFKEEILWKNMQQNREM